MATTIGSKVHPRYKGVAEWRVKAVAELSGPIRYPDPVRGHVAYEPRILSLQSPAHGRVLWFAYWISTRGTGGKRAWGGGAPMLEEGVLLELLRDAIAKGMFTKSFLRKLKAELDAATAP
jgi:hypothetical protein